MTVYGYLRVSTEEQSRSGLGLAAQRQTIAAKVAGEEVEWRADEGVSGSVAPESRPVLASVLAGLRRDDVLVVAKLDRLGRSALDVLRLAEDARDRRWRLVACDLGLDTGTPVGAFTLTALAAVAQLERDLIAQRTREALAEKRRQGVRLGGPVLLPDEVRHRVVAIRASGMTLRAVASALNAEGVPTARGGRWHGSTVRSVCSSVALDGEMAAIQA